jgi:single-stranded DNA-binding protein
VDGRLRSRSWEDEDGKRRSAVEVVANRVDFLDSRTREESPFEAVAS